MLMVIYFSHWWNYCYPVRYHLSLSQVADITSGFPTSRVQGAERRWHKTTRTEKSWNGREVFGIEIRCWNDTSFQDERECPCAPLALSKSKFLVSLLPYLSTWTYSSANPLGGLFLQMINRIVWLCHQQRLLISPCLLPPPTVTTAHIRSNSRDPQAQVYSHGECTLWAIRLSVKRFRQTSWYVFCQSIDVFQSVSF